MVRRVFFSFHYISNVVIGATLLLPLIGLVLGYILAPSVEPDNTRFLLSGLAGAQAAVLAIVFSVTVIGIQLTGTRYSPRMVSIFTDSPIFLYTFTLFVVSIGIDFWLLYTVPSSVDRVHTAGVFAASGLSVAVSVTLYVFVKSAVNQSTPEGAIEMFVAGMTTDAYISRVEGTVQDGSEYVHPMHPLYNMTMNALSQGEHVTARKALQEYGDVVRQTLEDVKERDVLSTAERDVGNKLFDPVLTEHLHDIALHAEEHDNAKIIGDAIDIQYDLGKSGLDLSDDRVSRQAEYGLSGVIRDSPVEAGDLIANNNAWNELGNLLVDAAEYPRPKIVWSISGSIEQNVQRQLWKISDIHWYGSAMMDLYRSMEATHEALLDHYENEIAEAEIDWQHDYVPDDIPHREELEAVHRLRKALFDTSTYFLRHAINEGTYPITEGNFMAAWHNICVEASETAARDYAVVLCQALIELAVIDYSGLGEEGLPWDSKIARVKFNGNPEVVDEAFDRMLEYEWVETGPEPFVVGQSENRYETYYSNLISVEQYRPLNTQEDYEDLLRELREAVDERWQSLEASRREKEHS